jgi:RNAse (barnase) inhibitor barstar
MKKNVLRSIIIGIVLADVAMESVAFFDDIKTEPVYRAFFNCFGSLTVFGVALWFLFFKKAPPETMKELFMDASQWKTADDLYLSFFEAVEAPAWHGKNLDAVRESIGAGRINGIEVPYRLVLRNYDHLPGHLKEKADAFIQVISDLAKEGIPVEIRIESSS